MFNLTLQERRVVLFLSTIVLLGLGINFACKINSRIDRFTKVDDCIIKIDINQAGYQDLLEIKGISSRLAKNIIAYRNNYGLFRDLEELKEVKGIGEFRYNQIKDYLNIR